MPDLFSAVRAEALFASNLQSSDMPGAEAVRNAVATALRRLGVRGCAAQVAGEFGDHPETAVTRMAWAIATVGNVYPTRGPAARRTLRLIDHRTAELTLAS
jgi:hypothetical protein